MGPCPYMQLEGLYIIDELEAMCNYFMTSYLHDSILDSFPRQLPFFSRPLHLYYLLVSSMMVWNFGISSPIPWPMPCCTASIYARCLSLSHRSSYVLGSHIKLENAWQRFKPILCRYNAKNNQFYNLLSCEVIINAVPFLLGSLIILFLLYINHNMLS